jgi:hypothetical protein
MLLNLDSTLWIPIVLLYTHKLLVLYVVLLVLYTVHQALHTFFFYTLVKYFLLLHWFTVVPQCTVTANAILLVLTVLAHYTSSSIFSAACSFEASYGMSFSRTLIFAIDRRREKPRKIDVREKHMFYSIYDCEKLMFYSTMGSSRFGRFKV